MGWGGGRLWLAAFERAAETDRCAGLPPRTCNRSFNTNSYGCMKHNCRASTPSNTRSTPECQPGQPVALSCLSLHARGSIAIHPVPAKPPQSRAATDERRRRYLPTILTRSRRCASCQAAGTELKREQILLPAERRMSVTLSVCSRYVTRGSGGVTRR